MDFYPTPTRQLLYSNDLVMDNYLTISQCFKLDYNGGLHIIKYNDHDDELNIYTFLSDSTMFVKHVIKD